MFSRSKFIENNKRQTLNYSLREFVASFLWFLNIGDTKEKLGLIRMLICNIKATNLIQEENCNRDKNALCPKKEKEEILNKMLDDIQKMIEDDTVY